MFRVSVLCSEAPLLVRVFSKGALKGASKGDLRGA